LLKFSVTLGGLSPLLWHHQHLSVQTSGSDNDQHR
jgi:hypothetical protein